MKPLLNIEMDDGSRMFLSLPEFYPWQTFRDHLAKLKGLTVTALSTDNVTGVWIDFTYEGYIFSINNPSGEFWFYVDDPLCPDSVLGKVVAHSTAFFTV